MALSRTTFVLSLVSIHADKCSIPYSVRCRRRQRGQRARRCLLSLQNPDGHWRGELQGDTILESEYILLMAFLGRENET